MFGEIEPVGYESSRRIGKMILQSLSLKIILPDDDVTISLQARERNEFFYTDYIKNAINSFTIVSHVVRTNGAETDVIGTFFLREENDYKVLSDYIESVNRQQRKSENKERTVPSRKDKVKLSNNEGWLSKRREV